MTTATVGALVGVTKVYRHGNERANWRALVPGPWGDRAPGAHFKALDDVSFSVAPGRALGLIGRNGAGKSTALKILAGVVRPSSGQVVHRGRVASAIELGVGFNPDFTGAENVVFAGTLLGLTPADMRSRYDEIVDFAGIGPFMDMPVKRYSTGMLARLGFALVSTVEADLVLLDEVLSVGDWAFRRKSLERIRELHAGGTAIVAVSHDHWTLSQICQELVLLEEGRVVAYGEPEEVVNQYLGPHAVEKTAPDLPATVDDVPIPPVLNSPIRLTELVLTPDALRPGAELRFRTRIEVDAPVDAKLVASIFFRGRSICARPIVGPSEVLSRPGVWVVEGRLPWFPMTKGHFELRVVATTQELGDLHEFPGAEAEVSGTFWVIGSSEEDVPDVDFQIGWTSRLLTETPAQSDPGATDVEESSTMPRDR